MIRGDTVEEVRYKLMNGGEAKPLWTGVAADRYHNPDKVVRPDGGGENA